MTYAVAFKKAIDFTTKTFKGVEISKVLRYESGGSKGFEWTVLLVEFSLYNPIIQSGQYYEYTVTVTKEGVKQNSEVKEC